MSKRTDVINYFIDACGSTFRLTIVSNCSKHSPGTFDFYILDPSLLIGLTGSALRWLEDYVEKIICILPFDIPNDIRNFVDATFKYVIPYPVDVCHLKKAFIYVNKLLNRKLDFNSHALFEDDDIPDTVLGYFCGSSAKIKMVRKQIFQVAKLHTPVLLLGETGTGKSKAAELIHSLSDVGKKKWVTKSISSISESLAESTFFGHVKGAFTNADRDEIGLFEQAIGTTLFFDEFGEASLYIQAMLLTVLDAGKFTKVGSGVQQQSDARLIFATNADLARMMREGTFRPELYYRIYDNTITLPSLRERKEDIPEMVNNLISRDEYTILDEAMEKLMEHDWRGNLREFNKCMANAMIEAKDRTIRADHISFGSVSFLR